MERLWEIDIFPYSKNPKAVIRSKRDQQAFECLEQQTERHEINGIQRYAIPLLRVKYAPLLHAPPEAVLPTLHYIERQLSKNPEIQKLIDAGYVKTEFMGSGRKS